ncbi:MAG: VanZ family protein [Phycisphaeraceae bacterium]|nr:VanZ family protein [Phycisphaeraceae bacterium]MBX3366526.1 VanZ family protein [Phycisphaeraceae bacterium]
MIAVPRAVYLVGFGVYALALFIATHWPRLAIDSPIRGTDKIIHVGVFFVWTLLLAAAVRHRRPRLRTLGLIACGYAALDEGLQAIPALGRTCSWWDLLANVVGVGLGLVVIWLIRRRSGKRALAERRT